MRRLELALLGCACISATIGCDRSECVAASGDGAMGGATSGDTDSTTGVPPVDPPEEPPEPEREDGVRQWSTLQGATAGPDGGVVALVRLDSEPGSGPGAATCWTRLVGYSAGGVMTQVLPNPSNDSGPCEIVTSYDDDGTVYTVDFTGWASAGWHGDPLFPPTGVAGSLSISRVVDGIAFLGVDDELVRLSPSPAGLQWSSLALPELTEAVAIRDDGGAWVVTSETLTAVDASFALQQRIEVGPWATALALDAEQRVYVGGNGLTRYTGDGSQDGTFTPDRSLPSVIEVRRGPDASVYVLYRDESEALRIRRLDVNGSTLWDAPTSPPILETATRHRLAVDSDGNVIVAGTATNELAKHGRDDGRELWKVSIPGFADLF